MFGRHHVTLDEAELLSNIYDFVLDESITERERRIGLLAKADLEAKRYPVAVLNKIVVSFQMEALNKKGLSPVASKFYDQIEPLLVAVKPFGTNIGFVGMHCSYLDD